MDSYILQTCDRDIAKVKYEIAMKSVDYAEKELANAKIKKEWSHIEYKEEVLNRKERLFMRNDYELEIIGIQKKMLEIDLELLEDKKKTFIHRLPPPQSRPSGSPPQHSGE
jgi:hypothetical protein